MKGFKAIAARRAAAAAEAALQVGAVTAAAPVVTEPVVAVKKRDGRGRKPLPESEKRVVRYVTWLTKEESERVEQLRGKQLRGEWLREAAFGNAPSPVPEINLQAYKDLRSALSNLNQIAHSVNSGKLILTQSDVLNEINTVRNQLIGLTG